MTVLGTDGNGTAGGSNQGGAAQGGNAGAGSGSGANGSAGAASGASSAGTGTGSGGGQTSWRDSLPDDLKADPSLLPFQDVAALAKSYKHTASMVGKKGVIKPGEKASDEEWQHFYKELGRPELEKYEVTAPKDSRFQESFLKQYKEMAFKQGLMPRQAQAILEFATQDGNATLETMKKNVETQQAQALEGLRKEWGEGYGKQTALANQAVKQFGGPKLQEHFAKNPELGNDVELIKAWAKVGQFLGEDKLRGEGAGRYGNTPAETQSKLDDYWKNPAHPARDPKHPGYQRAKAEIEELFQQKAMNTG